MIRLKNMKLFIGISPQGKAARRSSPWVLGVTIGLLLAGCGGSPSPQPQPEAEAVVMSVTGKQQLEGTSPSSNSLLEFEIVLNKPVVRSLAVTFNTKSTSIATAPLNSTGSAQGGSACGVGAADFVSVSSQQVSIAAGQSTGKLAVTVCSDAVFEPNETFHLNWTSLGSAGGVAMGTLINDDAGGLNGSGTTVLLGGLPATGRDVNPETNSATDGALGFSFDKSNTGCVVDNVTGLAWQSLTGVTRTYADLDAYIATVNLAKPCGKSDWRVPTVNELIGLMNASKTTVSPATVINADYVGANLTSADVMTGQFWTSESRAVAVGPADDAWQVDVSNGAVISFVSKLQTRGVRLVSGNTRSLLSCSANSRFTDFTDGTIEDGTTGLMWKTCPEGYAYSAGMCVAGTKTSFTGATEIVSQLNAANTAKAAGYADWRVPTKNEMESLVSRACTGSTIDSKFGLGTGNLNFVTSTLDADAPLTRVWGVNFDEGSIGPNQLSNAFRLRLVRAGQ